MKWLKWKDVIFLAVDTAEKYNLVEKDLELFFYTRMETMYR